MHRQSRGLIGLTIVVLLLAMAGCSSGGDDAAALVYTAIEDAAKEALPSYGSASSSSLAASATWQLGKPIYELYGVLEDDPDVNVGYFNLWDLISEADSRFTEMMNNGQEIEQISVTAPEMAVMTTAQTYNRYNLYEDGSGTSETFAMEDGDVLRLVSANTVGTTEKSVVHAIYNEASGELQMEMLMANYVDEDEGSTIGWEMVRVYAAGNTASHSFTMKVVRDGVGYDHNIVGAGVSEGSDNYFLLQLTDNENFSGTWKYYHIAAEATVSELQALDDNGSADAATAGDPDNHAADLPTPFVAADDLPTDGDAMNLSMPDPTAIGAAAY